jgi:hypothetical protein
VTDEGEDLPPEGATEVTEYQTLASGFLSPRHRRLAQLAAAGGSNKSIAEELGYCDSRISILLKNPHIVLEIKRLQDRIFEETIQARLKTFSEPALNNIHMILTDRTNRVKVSEKAEMSKWVIEKLDGKASQKLDIGENLLGVLLDRLDAQRTSPSGRDVTEVRMLNQPETAAPPDELADWVNDLGQQE